MSLRQWLWLWLLSVFWGSAFIFIEVALPTLSPLLIVTGRMVIAAIVLNGVLWFSPQQPALLSKASPLLWLQCGGLSLLNNLIPFGLVVWAQQHISASLASILIAAAPLFTVLLAVFILRDRMTLARGLGVVLGFAGVVVLVGPEVLRGLDLQGIGELAILGAALSYAVAGFAGRRFKAFPSQLISTMTVTMGAVIIVPLTLIVEWPFTAGPFIADGSLIEWRWSAFLAVAALGIFSTGLAYLLYFRLLAEAGVVNTSLVSFLVPLSALILGTVFLHERLDSAAIIGVALILSGLAVLDGRLLGKLGVPS
ncbi:MAG: DMT family transporter [Phormidesmis sp.]